MKLDIGCGPNKKSGFFGMDIHPYPGVDLIQDLAQTPWRIDDSVCDEIWADQVIEHIPDLVNFFSELRRIARDGCCIRLATPHYSSHNSWADPTHIHHLSVSFCDPLAKGYLSERLPGFSIVQRRISFGSLIWTWPARLVCAVFGYRVYEKRFCWMFPASSIIVELRVDKHKPASDTDSVSESVSLPAALEI